MVDPTGLGIGQATSTPLSGPLVYLLPYIEQTNLFNSLSPTPSINFAQYEAQYVAINGNTGWWGSPTYNAAAQAKIKSFLCPSDNPDSPTIGVWVGYYPDPSGTYYGVYYPNPPPYGKSNILPTAGYRDIQTPSLAGVFGVLSTNKVSVIPDGAAYTTFFGEALGDGLTAPRNFSLTWMGSSALGTAWGLRPPFTWYTFGSRHVNSVMFVWGDGTVRPIKTNPDYNNYIYSTAMADQQVVNPSAIGQ